MDENKATEFDQLQSDIDQKQVDLQKQLELEQQQRLNLQKEEKEEKAQAELLQGDPRDQDQWGLRGLIKEEI